MKLRVLCLPEIIDSIAIIFVHYGTGSVQHIITPVDLYH